MVRHRARAGPLSLTAAAVCVESVEPIEWRQMPDLPPCVEAKDVIRVRATVRDLTADAAVLGWCGKDVYTWQSGMGKHLGWVPAGDVTRGE